MPVGGSQKGGQLLLFGGAGDSKTFWLTDNTSVSDLMGSLQYAFPKKTSKPPKDIQSARYYPFSPVCPMELFHLQLGLSVLVCLSIQGCTFKVNCLGTLGQLTGM